MDEIIFHHYVICPHCHEEQRIVDEDKIEYILPNLVIDDEEEEIECMFCEKMFFCKLVLMKAFQTSTNGKQTNEI